MLWAEERTKKKLQQAGPDRSVQLSAGLPADILTMVPDSHSSSDLACSPKKSRAYQSLSQELGRSARSAACKLAKMWKIFRPLVSNWAEHAQMHKEKTGVAHPHNQRCVAIRLPVCLE